MPLKSPLSATRARACAARARRQLRRRFVCSDRVMARPNVVYLGDSASATPIAIQMKTMPGRSNSAGWLTID